MLLTLAAAALVRHRARTILAVLGVAVSAAMLLDMVMLATGMRESFRELLTARGFQLRLAPRGTLPFDTEATISDAGRVTRLLRARPDVELVSPVLGASVHVTTRALPDRPLPAFALGLEPAAQGDYELVGGDDALTPDAFVANDDFMRLVGARLGDTLEVAAGYDAQLRSFAGRRTMVLAGRARFLYLSAGQAAVALPLATLQAMTGMRRDDRVSLFMVRLTSDADVEAARAAVARDVPTVSAISTAEAIRQVDERLSYFRQLAFILGAVSLVVGFLLVTTLVTISVNERAGEIAVMRAIGVSRMRVVWQVVLEGIAISLVGAALGLGLGLVTARYLEGILAAFPGLPAALRFFLFQPRDAYTALGLLVVSGILAGVYPSWRAASLPLATTLRTEAIA